MKTKEELNQIKEEYVELYKKLAELTEDELKQISGGTQSDCPLADQPYRCATHCRKYPCGNNLQGLMGNAWYCPITNEQMSD